MKLCQNKIHSYDELVYKKCPECFKNLKYEYMKIYTQRDYVKEKASKTFSSVIDSKLFINYSLKKNFKILQEKQ